MTIILPYSNLNSELCNIQKMIFSETKCPPSPFPLLIVSLDSSAPRRPTRKEIQEKLPEKLSFRGMKLSHSNLILEIKEQIPNYCDPLLSAGNFTYNNGFILCTGPFCQSIQIGSLPVPETESCNKYSLACYEINSGGEENFWMNMRWNKLWEVKKGQKKI
jgi:hypothetical protein